MILQQIQWAFKCKNDLMLKCDKNILNISPLSCYSNYSKSGILLQKNIIAFNHSGHTHK